MKSMQRKLATLIAASHSSYLHYHAPRYRALLSILFDYYEDGFKLLDVGNSPSTEILSEILDCQIDVIGLKPDKTLPFGQQYQFDLNQSQFRPNWRSDIGAYDIIIFTEVLEHLHTSPSLVLDYLSSLLKDGGIMILQTPNAVVLHKRFQMLFGLNPYMLINEDASNPGHFREYTMAELTAYAQKARFTCLEKTFTNYFDYRYDGSSESQSNPRNGYRLINLLYALAPPSWKPGISMILQK